VSRAARARLIEAFGVDTATDSEFANLMPWEAECPLCGSVGPDLCGHADIVSGWGNSSPRFLGIEDIAETARIEREWAA
jgi:hypothetical protein